MSRRKGLTIRQKVDGHEVRIEELEKSNRYLRDHVDRLEEKSLDPDTDIVEAYYWAVWRAEPLAKPFIVRVVPSPEGWQCLAFGNGNRAPLHRYKLIGLVAPP